MTHPMFTCRYTLQRLGESYDELKQKEEGRNRIKIPRVEYEVIITGEDKKTVSINKERILFGLDSSDSEHIQQVLEQDMPAPEGHSLRGNISGFITRAANIAKPNPKGDNAQM